MQYDSFDFNRALSHLSDARNRFSKRLNSSLEKANTESIEIDSPESGVCIVINSDHTIRSLDIDQDSYEDHDGESLARSVVQSYNTARHALRQEQRLTVLRSIKQH